MSPISTQESNDIHILDYLPSMNSNISINVRSSIVSYWYVPDLWINSCGGDHSRVPSISFIKFVYSKGFTFSAMLMRHDCCFKDISKSKIYDLLSYTAFYALKIFPIFAKYILSHFRFCLESHFLAYMIRAIITIFDSLLYLKDHPGLS